MDLHVTQSHSMYGNKLMRADGLMQAIARVNLVLKNKPGGLVVDYIGPGVQLQHTLVDYTEASGQGKAAGDLEEVAVMMKEGKGPVK